MNSRVSAIRQLLFFSFYRIPGFVQHLGACCSRCRTGLHNCRRTAQLSGRLRCSTAKVSHSPCSLLRGSLSVHQRLGLLHCHGVHPAAVIRHLDHAVGQFLAALGAHSHCCCALFHVRGRNAGGICCVLGVFCNFFCASNTCAARLSAVHPAEGCAFATPAIHSSFVWIIWD